MCVIHNSDSSVLSGWSLCPWKGVFCLHLVAERGTPAFNLQVVVIVLWLLYTWSNKGTRKKNSPRLGRSLRFGLLGNLKMSDRCLELQMNSDRKGNFIPLGRQLPRTPPYHNPSKQSRVAQQVTDSVFTQLLSMKMSLNAAFYSLLNRWAMKKPMIWTAHLSGRVWDKVTSKQMWTSLINIPTHSVILLVPLADPQSMLKGMKGYQLTPVDLEFMQKMNEEKELKNLQVNSFFFLLWKLLDWCGYYCDI